MLQTKLFERKTIDLIKFNDFLQLYKNQLNQIWIDQLKLRTILNLVDVNYKNEFLIWRFNFFHQYFSNNKKNSSEIIKILKKLNIYYQLNIEEKNYINILKNYEFLENKNLKKQIMDFDYEGFETFYFIFTLTSFWSETDNKKILNASFIYLSQESIYLSGGIYFTYINFSQITKTLIIGNEIYFWINNDKVYKVVSESADLIQKSLERLWTISHQ